MKIECAECGDELGIVDDDGDLISVGPCQNCIDQEVQEEIRKLRNCIEEAMNTYDRSD